MGKLIEYENGLRLIVEHIPALRSVCAGIWVGTGSVRENDENNGISHFTEHMLFKGTDKLNAFEIANAFESYGAQVNAFTSKECTCYFYKSIGENAEKCFELLSDIFFDSAFPDDELDRERKVILEEINMVEDAPEDICYDLLAQSVYGGHPLGKTILGPADNVKRFKKDDILKYTKTSYCAGGTVISIAGNISPKTADAYVRKYILPKICANSVNLKGQTAHKIAKNHIERIKDFEQSNIAVSFPSVRLNDKLSTVQQIFNTMFGGSMSSRLFQRIREELGLAYSIYSAPSSFSNNGTFNIILNINVQNTLEALNAVRGEIERVKSGDFSESELARAKTQVKSSLVFAQENVQSIMSSNGKLLTIAGEVYDIDKKIKDIDAVTVKSVADFTNLIFGGEVCTAYVGKAHNVDFGNIF